MKEIVILQAQYEALLDFNNEYYGKDFKSHSKFISGAINKMLKNKEPIEDIKSFLEDAIDVHTKNYLN